MSKIFFDELKMPKPDVYLGIGSGTHAGQTARIMLDFEKVCDEKNPSMVIVAGDVNSTIACALVAAKLLIPVAHVELDMDLEVLGLTCRVCGEKIFYKIRPSIKKTVISD